MYIPHGQAVSIVRTYASAIIGTVGTRLDCTDPMSCSPSSSIGCAFVTFCKRESAERAMEELHDKATLPGVSECVCVHHTCTCPLGYIHVVCVGLHE